MGAGPCCLGTGNMSCCHDEEWGWPVHDDRERFELRKVLIGFAQQRDKLLFIGNATVGMGLAPSVGEAALVRRIDGKNGKIEGIRPTFL